MDNQQTYLLNGLIVRQFELGRIARFRKVARGRQAETFELLTSQHNEYLVSIYPPAFDAAHLNFVATTINTLDKERFSVVPILSTKPGVSDIGGGGGANFCQNFPAEGPQGSTILLSFAPIGSPLPPDQYTELDISQLGLRLAWLHRLFVEQLPAPSLPPLPVRFEQLLASPEFRSRIPNFPTAMFDHLRDMLNMLPSPGWSHGDIQPTAQLIDADHQLRSIVDFALLHFGSPLEDLVDAFLTIANLQNVRGKALLEAYDSLIPIRRVPWTPIVAAWFAQRIIDAAHNRRPLPRHFTQLLTAPENLATAIASCL